MLKIGNTLTFEKTILPSETANTIGSGSLEVFSTPMLIAFMENIAYKLVENDLEKGDTTVGIHIDAKHLSANLVGDTIVGTATITEIDGKKITFDITVRYNDNIVGTAIHSRFIVNSDKFLSKLKR